MKKDTAETALNAILYELMSPECGLKSAKPNSSDYFAVSLIDWMVRHTAISRATAVSFGVKLHELLTISIIDRPTFADDIAIRFRW